jgi:hypothetical protein
VLRKPRDRETAADIAAEAQQDQEGPLIEIQVVEEVVEEDGERAGNFEIVGAPPATEGDGARVADGAQQGGVVEVAPQEAGGDAQILGRPQAPDENAEQAQLANVDNENWQIRQDIPLRQIMIHTMGALFFPAVASYSGEVLKFALPARYTYPHVGLRSTGWHTGLLRAKWGRTIIGGCLFILLKDAVTLYVKWKRARDFGKKKILDYTGPRKTAV